MGKLPQPLSSRGICYTRRRIKSVAGNNMNQETFEKEIAMCRGLYKKSNGKCNWGECRKCGVIPLLYKLSKGKIYEKEDEIKKLKQAVLQ